MAELKARNDLLDKKKDELHLIIGGVFDSVYFADGFTSSSHLNDFYNSGFINISAPKEKIEPQIIHMLTMDSLNNYKKGESIKPGNIILNFKKLVDSLPEITAAVVSVFLDIPILKVCAALTVWKTLRNLATIEITKLQAVVIYALWKHCNKEHKISLEDGFERTNNLMRSISEAEMMWDAYVEIILELSKLRCLEVNEAGIWLREWISKEYR